MFPTVREGRWRIKARATIISPGTLSLTLSFFLFLPREERGGGGRGTLLSFSR